MFGYGKYSDHDGVGLALFYGDFFARESKSGGARMGNFVEQSQLNETRPVIYNVCNYQNRQKVSLHCYCGMMLLRYFMSLGTRCMACSPLSVMPRFQGPTLRVILLSFLRRLTNTGRVIRRSFACFARHVDTGEQMPQALRNKMQQASLFNKGYDMTELLSAALLDMRWHRSGK